MRFRMVRIRQGAPNPSLTRPAHPSHHTTNIFPTSALAQAAWLAEGSPDVLLLRPPPPSLIVSSARKCFEHVVDGTGLPHSLLSTFVVGPASFL
jgi:hypothetical protein